MSTAKTTSVQSFAESAPPPPPVMKPTASVPPATKRSTKRPPTPAVGTVTFDRAASSPLSSYSEGDVTESTGDSGRVMIPKPTAASRTPTAMLFPTWNPEEKENVTVHWFSIAGAQINAEFPILKDYEQNWAANRILQAHLKVTAAAATKTSSRRVVQAVASVMIGPGVPATARRRSAN
ncbi:hypothetical protein B0H10DRAFT_1941946 [Mycena sp. CBHHK59/15]|nr:hypothetical protein B0H10DRAFT_1941946 [Mycena sp. CBHHK59/15]